MTEQGLIIEQIMLDTKVLLLFASPQPINGSYWIKEREEKCELCIESINKILLKPYFSHYPLNEYQAKQMYQEINTVYEWLKKYRCQVEEFYMKDFNDVVKYVDDIDRGSIVFRWYDVIEKLYVKISNERQNFILQNVIPEEQDNYYDERLLAYYRNDKKVCDRFFAELKKHNPLKPHDVKKAFLLFQPDIKTLEISSLAKLLEELSGVTISKQNMGEVIKWCKNKGIPTVNNKTKKEKQG